MNLDYRFIEFKGPLTKEDLIYMLTRNFKSWTNQKIAKVMIELDDTIPFQIPDNFNEIAKWTTNIQEMEIR